MMTPTGRTRWRSQQRLFRREELVLQLEWSGWVVEWNGYYADSENRTEWRDARSEDMARLQPFEYVESAPPIEAGTRQ